VGPDNLVFDDDGTMYATEITEGRVSAMASNGITRVVYDQIPVANPITFHAGMLIAGELRIGGRIMQLDLNGSTPRIILEDVPMPNAMEVGPDGKLYFPVMAANEIWRVDLKGGSPEKVDVNLGVPDSVKFDGQGYIVSTQVYSGQVLRIDPRNGKRTVLAQLSPGLDKLTFVGQRLFVSNIAGSITEVLADGLTRDLVPEGLNWPLGLAIGSDGELFVADGDFCYALTPGQARRALGVHFTPGYPGYVRGVAAAAPGEYIVTTANGGVARYWPAQQRSETLASGFTLLSGIATAPGGAIVFAEQEQGRVLSVRQGGVDELVAGLLRPAGIAIAADGTPYVGESAARRIVRVSASRCDTVLDSLQDPQGIAVQGSRTFMIDAGAKALVEYDLHRRTPRTILANLPVGAPPGVIPRPPP
jgi:sugar lactone lactonase YvrE